MRAGFCSKGLIFKNEDIDYSVHGASTGELTVCLRRDDDQSPCTAYRALYVPIFSICDSSHMFLGAVKYSILFLCDTTEPLALLRIVYDKPVFNHLRDRQSPANGSGKHKTQSLKCTHPLS